LGFSLWRQQAADPVKIELEELKQKIRQLLINNFNITIADILSHKSGKALGVRILKKVADANTVNKVHHNKQA
jgi:hypothetical protein